MELKRFAVIVTLLQVINPERISILTHVIGFTTSCEEAALGMMRRWCEVNYRYYQVHSMLCKEVSKI